MRPVAFEFATAGRIIFGPGTFREAGKLAQSLGSRALVVTGSSPQRATPLLDLLRSNGVATAVFPLFGEPTVSAVLAGVAQARAQNSHLVIGFGGGSAIDAGKAIAALLTNPGEPLDYLEVIGRGQSLTVPPLPFIAIPTTAGTGAEVTRNAVLASPDHRVKVSLRSPLMLPRLAIVDPELTWELPPALSASTGLDALTQLVEPYLSCKANPLTDALCVEGIPRAARSLRTVCAPGAASTTPVEAVKQARTDMALASLHGGVALANAGLGAVHGFAGPLGGMFPAPHGALCAALLPHVMAMNLRAVRARGADQHLLARFETVARLLTARSGATADEGVEWVRALCADLGIAGLRQFGIGPADSETIVQKASAASSMKGNPIPLTNAELWEILRAAW